MKLYSTVQYCTILYNRLKSLPTVVNVMPALRVEFMGRVHWHKSRTSKSVHIYVKIRQSPEIMKHVDMLVNRDVKGVLYIPVKESSKAKGLATGGGHG